MAQRSPARHRAVSSSSSRTTSSRSAAIAAVVGLIVATVAVFIAPRPSSGAPIQPFAAVYHAQINGQIALVGNAVMTCPSAASGCSAAQTNATPATTAQVNGINDNDFVMTYIDIDSDSSTFDSSSADLTLGNQAAVQFAALVWTGRPLNAAGGAAFQGDQTTMKLKVPGSSTYTTITASRTDRTTPAADANAVYSSYADVTSLVRSAGAGTYVGANVAAAGGADRWGGWSLVVAYRQSSLPLRDLTVFNGFEQINSSNPSDSFTISGFKAPPNGEVRARLGVVAYDGDMGYVGDQLQVNGTAVSTTVSPTNNFFDSTDDVLGTAVTTRNPSYRNLLGFDIKDIAAPGTIPNGATSANVALTTGGEAYFPSILTTTIDLYAPNFNSVTKTVTDLSGNSPAAAGDTLQYTLSYTNTGGDPANNVVARDPLPANVTYVPGSLKITDGANAGTKTDAADGDQADYVSGSRTVRFRLGAGANGTTGGTLTPNSSDAANSTSTATFRVTLDRASAGTTVSNTSFLDYHAQTLDTDYTFVGNTVSTPVDNLADLALTGSVAPDPTTAGGTVTYSFTATNNGPNAAAGSVFTATLPSGVTATAASTSVGTCTISGQTITCPLGTVANGAAPTITITGKVASGTSANSLSVTGQVTATTSDPDASNNTVVLSSQVGTSADVAVTNTGPATITPGNQATYTVKVTNNGPSDATSVTLTDTLPSGLTFSSVSGGTCTQSNGVISCPIGTLAAGDSRTYTVVATLASGYSGASVSTTAGVTTTTADSVAANNQATATSTVNNPVADVQITGTAAPTTASAGSNEQFAYTVRNNGPSDASGVVVTVPVPTGTTFVSVTTRTGACTYNAGARTATCTVGSLPANGTTAVLLTVGVNPDTTATIVSTGSVASTSSDPVTTNNSASVSAPVTASADLSVTLTGDDPTLAGGQTETYTLTAVNNGPATGRTVVFTQTLPDGFTAGTITAPAGVTCTVSGTPQVVRCTADRIDPGQRLAVTVPATAPGTLPADVSSTAQISAATADPDNTNNTATYDLTGANSADLQVTVSDSPDPVVAGNQLTYTVVVTNNGPSTATAVQLTDVLSPLLDTAGATATPGQGACVAGATTTCALGVIASGDSVTVTIVATVLTSTTTAIPNDATVSSATTDPTTSNNEAMASTAVQTRADYAVTQTVPATATAGQTFTYTITATNTGPSDAALTRIKEPLPTGFVFQSATGTGTTCTAPGGVLTCVLNTLAASETRPITVTVKLDPATPTGSVDLAAVITSTTPEAAGDTANDRDTRSVTVVGRAGVTITDTISPDPVTAGQSAEATITVTNSGPSDAQTVTVTSPIPAGTTVQSVTTSAGTCTVGATTVTCTLGTVSPNAPVQIVVSLAVPGGATGTLTDQATVSSPTDSDTSDNTASDSAPIQQQADLALQITVQDDPITAGSGTVYNFTLNNAGPSDAVNVVLTGTLPVGVTPLRINAPAGVTCVPTSPDGRTIRCTTASLAAGGSLTGSLTVTTSPSLPDGTTLTNSATVSSDTPDANTANNTAAATTHVITAAALSVRQAAIPASVVVPGDGYEYRVTVSNSGPSDAQAVRVVDVLPPGVTATTATTPQGTCVITAGPDNNSIVTCDLGTVPAGSLVVDLFGVMLDPASTATSVTNTVTVTSPTAATPGGTGPQTVSSTLTTPVQPVADLVMSKSAGASGLAAGSTVTYTLGVANPDGPSNAPAAQIVDQLPTTLSAITVTAPSGTTCTQTANPDGTLVVCDTGVIAIGATVTVTITATLDAGTAAGTLRNTASVTSPADPDDSNNTATADVTVTTSADLVVQVTPGQTTATPGTATSYQIAVTNRGPSDAAAAQLTIPLPDGLTGVTVTRSDGNPAGCTQTGSTLTCPLGVGAGTALAAGGSITLTVSGTVDPSATDPLVEAATASSSTSDPAPANNTDSASVPVVPSADLAVTKTVTPTRPVPGQAATYTVTIRNPGPSDAHDVSVSDTVQDGQTPGTATVTGATGTCTTTGQDVECTIPSVAAGTTATVRIPVAVAAGFDSASFANQAVVTSPSDPNPTNNVGQVSGPTAAKADLRVTTTAAPQAPGSGDTAVPGRQVTYTVSVANDGPSDAQTVTLRDTIPAGATVVSATGAGWTCDTSGTPIVCTRPTLAASASSDITIVVALPADATGDQVDSASASATTADPSLPNNSDSVTVHTTPYADLQVAKSVAPAVPVSGGDATYTVTVHNAGPSDAPDVTITDPIQSGQTVTGTPTLTGASGTCAVDAGTVRCSIATLPATSTATLTITVHFAASLPAGTFTNTATATSPARGQTAGDNTATVSGPNAAEVDLQVTKTGPATAAPGGPVTWTIAVHNDGPSAATRVAVTDTVPTGVTVTDVTVEPAAGATCTTGATVACTIATIASGGTATVTITGRIAAGATGSLVNSASALAADQTETADGDNTSTATTALVPNAVLAVTKTVDPGTLVPGQPATYTITVTDNGPSDATAVEVRDPLPTGLQPTSVTASQGTCTLAATIVCQIGTVADGDSATVTVEVDVAASYPGDSVSNTATATSPDATDPGTATRTSPTHPLVRLDIAKTVDDDTAMVGDEVHYTVTVTNNGPSDGTAVVVDDKLPDGLRYVSDETSQGSYDVDTGEWQVGALAVGDTATMTMTVEVVAPGQLLNVATVDPSTPGTTTQTLPDPAEAGVDAVSISRNGGGGHLSYTGAPADQAARLGLLALAVGLALLVFGRRRRRT